MSGRQWQWQYLGRNLLLTRSILRDVENRRIGRHLRSYSGPTSRQQPIVIIGAGPVGLFTALLLTRYEVPTIIIERKAAIGDVEMHGEESGATENVPVHPKSHVLHTRTVELLRQVGLEPELQCHVKPDFYWRRFRYCESLLGESYASIDHLATKSYREVLKASPSRLCQLSQPLLETILYQGLRTANESSPEDEPRCEIRLNHSFNTLHMGKDATGSPRCTVEVQNHLTNEANLVNCCYVLACDGAHSKLRDEIGINLSGVRDLETFASIHFTSVALSELMLSQGKEPAMLTFVFNSDTICVAVSHDFEQGNWVIQAPMLDPTADHRAWPLNEQEEFAHSVIQGCIGAWDQAIDYDLHSVRVWSMGALHADRYSFENKVFLVGDSCHQFPPSGGFGMNMGLVSAHNLAWKLAAVYHGRKTHVGEGDLLSTYEGERKPVLQHALKTSLDNYNKGLLAAKSLGLNRGFVSFATIARHSKLLSMEGSRGGSAFSKALNVGASVLLQATPSKKAEQLAQFVADEQALPMVFPDVDLGYSYRTPFSLQHNLRSTLQPGDLLPHLFVRKEGIGLVSLIDLLPMKLRYTVIALSTAAVKSEWAELAPLLYLCEPVQGMAWKDIEHESLQDVGHGLASLFSRNHVQAILVRPDGHIAETN